MVTSKNPLLDARRPAEHRPAPRIDAKPGTTDVGRIGLNVELGVYVLREDVEHNPPQHALRVDAHGSNLSRPPDALPTVNPKVSLRRQTADRRKCQRADCDRSGR